MTSGTKYSDQIRYSDLQVEQLVPAVWDAGHILNRPRSRTGDGTVKPPSDPRHVPDWYLGCADVQRAYYRCGLTEPERVVLRHIHWEGFRPGELAEAWSESPERVDATAASAVRKIRLWLNGEVPQ